jgi:hypothetical protein
VILALSACLSSDPGSERQPDDPTTDDGNPADTASDSGDPRVGDTSDDTADDVDIPAPVCPEDAGYVGEEPHLARTLAGEGDWWLDFDEEAEANGYVDCGYHRVWGETIEREGHAWQCPDCDWFTIGDGEVTEGYDDCTTLISGAEALRTEHLGLGTVDGALHLWRTGSENLALSDMGELTGAGTPGDPWIFSFGDEGEFTDGSGTFTLAATGSIVFGETSDTWVADVNVPREEPYTGGWPQCNPGGEPTDYLLVDGDVLPNARLVDQHGEAVDLWDFWGRYLVVDSSSPDCGPCIELSRHEDGWVEAMADDGVEVAWVTLLNASLGAVNLPADAETVSDWVRGSGSDAAVLADEGFGYTVLRDYIGGDGGMSYPTMVVVSPDMTVIGYDQGFGAKEGGGDGFDPIETLIRADIAVRYP